MMRQLPFDGLGGFAMAGVVVAAAIAKNNAEPRAFQNLVISSFPPIQMIDRAKVGKIDPEIALGSRLASVGRFRS